MSTTEHKPVAQVKHRSIGRVRARVARDERSPTQMDGIKRRLESQPGVQHVEVNSRTGSVLVQGSHDDQIQEALNAAFDLVRSLEEGEASDQAVGTIVEVVKEADARVRQLTAGRISLRWLVPATFVGVGVRQLLLEGLTLGAVPWYVLIYYGVDSFLKLYPEHAPRRESELERMHGVPPASSS